jgi:hypothetical protein
MNRTMILAGTLLTTALTSSGSAQPAAFSRERAGNNVPLARPIRPFVGQERGPATPGKRAGAGRIICEIVFGAMASGIAGVAAYKAVDDETNRIRNGDDPYSPDANTAYALGSWAGSAAMIHLIGSGDGSSAPLGATVLGTGVVGVPMLVGRRVAYLPLIGVFVAAPLQGLLGTIGYNAARK